MGLFPLSLEAHDWVVSVDIEGGTSGYSWLFSPEMFPRTEEKALTVVLLSIFLKSMNSDQTNR